MHRTLCSHPSASLPHRERHTEKYRPSSISSLQLSQTTSISPELPPTRRAYRTQLVANDAAQTFTYYSRLSKEATRDFALHPRRTSPRYLQPAATTSATYCTATEIKITCAEQKLAAFHNLLLSPPLAIGMQCIPALPPLFPGPHKLRRGCGLRAGFMWPLMCSSKLW